MAGSKARPRTPVIRKRLHCSGHQFIHLHSQNYYRNGWVHARRLQLQRLRLCNRSDLRKNSSWFSVLLAIHDLGLSCRQLHNSDDNRNNDCPAHDDNRSSDNNRSADNDRSPHDDGSADDHSTSDHNAAPLFRR